ncbi:MAG: hypothetical protein Q8L54_01690 [Devosia sp.]|nr:hypothetical protein [Devosia sp.]
MLDGAHVVDLAVKGFPGNQGKAKDADKDEDQGGESGDVSSHEGLPELQCSTLVRPSVEALTWLKQLVPAAEDSLRQIKDL